MLSLFRRLARDVSGTSAVECTLIVSLIAVAAFASMRSVGSKVSNILGNAGN
jgi:Flp pilus assembly pilin Flp